MTTENRASGSEHHGAETQQVSQPVRDLQWSLESPPLPSTQALPQDDTSDCQWESYHEALVRFLETRREHRVGRYFENLVRFWIEHIRSDTLLAHNEQVIHKGRTKGEIDFVFRTSSGELIHCETAVKFYLYHSTETSLGSHYIGPNTSDTLERKIDRLFNWQLPLGESFVPEATQRIAHVKGRIFYHPNQAPPSSFPEHLSPTHLKGTWIKSSEWNTFSESGNYQQFRVLRKPNWLADQIYQPDVSEHGILEKPFRTQLTEHFLKTDHSLMISAFNSSSPGSPECERIFVVADHWPLPLQK